MKLVFAGTPDFAVPTLRALLAAGHSLPLVLTQPDRPAGRGMQPQPSPVKLTARELGLTVAQPTSLREPETLQRLAEVAPDAMVVVAYGLILPQAVLSLPAYGCLNVHASLLPRWRGAAPIHRALLAGDKQTGVSIMAMDAGLDTGPVYLTQQIPITGTDTTGTLHDQLAQIGSQALTSVLDQLGSGSIVPAPQPEEGVTYAAKIAKEEAIIDWRQPAATIDRQIRAFNPHPGAATVLAQQRCKIWACLLVADDRRAAAPGEVLTVEADRFLVACGEGGLWITSLQRAGGRRMSSREFLAGTPLQPGMMLG